MSASIEFPAKVKADIVLFALPAFLLVSKARLRLKQQNDCRLFILVAFKFAALLCAQAD